MHTSRTLALCLMLAAGTAAAQETATITGSVTGGHTILRGLNETVMLTSVDHKLIVTNILLPLNVTKTLTPGRHTVHVRYAHHRAIADAYLWLDAEAGKAYVVRADAERNNVMFRIEEVATGAVVGGVDPGEDFKEDLPPPPEPQPASASALSVTGQTVSTP